MTDFQRCNRMFIRTLLPFAMLAQSCSDSPESALPAQDVTLKQGETLVVIKRQEESCTLEVLASRADNNAIVATRKMLQPSESAFVLRLNDIAGVDAITLWATCRDERSRIVEMGKTVIAVPSSASSVHFETKRLPVSGSWYRMTSPGATWSQNSIWAHSSNKAVITGNNGKLRIWNGFGWQEKVYADLGCINFSEVTGLDMPSDAFIASKYVDSKNMDCTERLAFALNLTDNRLSRKSRHSLSAEAAVSCGFHYASGAKLIYTSSSVLTYAHYIYADPGWALSDANSSPDTAGYVVYANSDKGKILSIAVSPFLLSKGPQKEPYPYWILDEQNTNQWILKIPTTGTVTIDAKSPFGLLKIDNMIAGKIVGSRSPYYEATWIIGEGLPKSPPSPQPPSIPVAIALPTAIAYATQEPSSPDKPEMLGSYPLNCGKIYTPSNDATSAYVLCSQPEKLNWLLTCREADEGKSVTCQSEKIVLSDLAMNEKLVGLDGKGSNQLWLIGDKGGIWLYQK